MQALQESRASMKGELGAHNWRFNPSAEAIVKASSNDDILALKLVVERDRLIDASRRTA